MQHAFVKVVIVSNQHYAPCRVRPRTRAHGSVQLASIWPDVAFLKKEEISIGLGHVGLWPMRANDHHFPRFVHCCTAEVPTEQAVLLQPPRAPFGGASGACRRQSTWRSWIHEDCGVPYTDSLLANLLLKSGLCETCQTEPYQVIARLLSTTCVGCQVSRERQRYSGIVWKTRLCTDWLIGRKRKNSACSLWRRFSWSFSWRTLLPLFKW